LSAVIDVLPHWAVIGILVVVGPLGEELYFRGRLLRVLDTDDQRGRLAVKSKNIGQRAWRPICAVSFDGSGGPIPSEDSSPVLVILMLAAPDQSAHHTIRARRTPEGSGRGGVPGRPPH